MGVWQFARALVVECKPQASDWLKVAVGPGIVTPVLRNAGVGRLQRRKTRWSGRTGDNGTADAQAIFSVFRTRPVTTFGTLRLQFQPVSLPGPEVQRHAEQCATWCAFGQTGQAFAEFVALGWAECDQLRHLAAPSSKAGNAWRSSLPSALRGSTATH